MPVIWADVDQEVYTQLSYLATLRQIPVQVAAQATGHGSVHVGVTDHGIGLPLDEQLQVFAPFYRGRDAKARRIPGAGLGLAIVHRLVEMHGGRVEIESVPGQGSTVHLWLPQAR